jgi:hypothetical protein
MDRQIYRLVHRQARNMAIEAIENAPDGFYVEIRPSTRTLEQNALFHAICGSIAKTKPFAGKMRSPDVWKMLLVSGHAMATKQGVEMMPGLEGEFVNLRESTARMSVARLNSLVEYAQAWCVENGIESI